MTNLARSATCRCRVTAQTEPHRSGDNITQASRLIRPITSGKPPKPTESTSELASASLATVQTASSAPPPNFKFGHAKLHPRAEKLQVASMSGGSELLGNWVEFSNCINKSGTIFWRFSQNERIQITGDCVLSFGEFSIFVGDL